MARPPESHDDIHQAQADGEGREETVREHEFRGAGGAPVDGVAGGAEEEGEEDEGEEEEAEDLVRRVQLGGLVGDC